MLSYLLGLVEICQFKRMTAVDGARPASKTAGGDAAQSYREKPQGALLSQLPLLELPELVSAPGPGTGRRQTLQTGN